MVAQLKKTAYVTLEEVKDHLNIKADNKDHDSRLTRLVNMACQKVETHIQGPVLIREFVDVQDGTSSNVLVPHYYPIRKVSEIRIDYAGDFTAPTSIIDSKYNAVRGYYRSLEFGVAGSDIVVRNDGNVSIVGRLFIGSVVQSIKVTYEAGLAHDMDEVPDDLKYATLMLIEYFYILRENRELGVKSKSNLNGQNYSRETDIPPEITSMLEPYVDYTFGGANRPQKNTIAI